MANGIVEGSNIIEINGKEVELKKLTLGNLETLEERFGSIEKALSSMKGIAYAIWLAAKRSGFDGRVDDIKDSIEFDQIQSVVAAIANQRTLILSADEAKVIADLIATAMMLKDNEDALHALNKLVEGHSDLLEGVKTRANALRSSRGEA